MIVEAITFAEKHFPHETHHRREVPFSSSLDLVTWGEILLCQINPDEVNRMIIP
jgi:hypothetical protein